MPELARDCVLLTIVNGQRILDSGSGVVVCHHHEKTFVLTCAHNLRARRKSVTGAYAAQIFVNGRLADPIQDAKLETRDLALLTVDGRIGTPAQWVSQLPAGSACRGHGFIGFFRHEFLPRTVNVSASTAFQTHTADGDIIAYLELRSGKAMAWFDKGMSGGPIHDRRGNLIGIARMREPDAAVVPEQPRGKQPRANPPSPAYALQLTADVMSIVQQLSGFDFKAVPYSSSASRDGTSLARNDERPPPPPPSPRSIDNDDIQKNRWGGRARDNLFKFGIENVVQYSRYFLFDAVVQSLDGTPLLAGPFVFHLHDTFRPMTIWVRKTDGVRAGCFDIGSTGVFTLGVQFRTTSGEWRALEYDLSSYKDGALAERYKA